jgi:hypothetical protein
MMTINAIAHDGAMLRHHPSTASNALYDSRQDKRLHLMHPKKLVPIATEVNTTIAMQNFFSVNRCFQQHSDKRRLHFGLGKAAQVDRIEVHWPAELCRNLRSRS